MTNQPKLDESQWQQILGLLEAATPVNGVAKLSKKDKLAWYERGAAVIAIKSALPRKRGPYTKKADATSLLGEE